MKNIILSIIALSALSIFSLSCRKNTPEPKPQADTIFVTKTDTLKIEVTPTTPVGKLTFEFENVDLDEYKLVFNTQKYLNANGDTFTVSKFKYLISNIKIKKADGTYWMPKESYYLINQEEANSMKFEIPGVPLGEYNNLEFSVGVDNVRNHTGAQTGALDPQNDMFWNWNSGYIFTKLEGHFVKTDGTQGALVFHIGSDANFKNLKFTSLPHNLNIREGKETDVHVIAKFQEMFGTPTTINFNDINNVMGGANATTVANNYVDMFEVHHVSNKN
jgi:hypothetical protein